MLTFVPSPETSTRTNQVVSRSQSISPWGKGGAKAEAQDSVRRKASLALPLPKRPGTLFSPKKKKPCLERENSWWEKKRRGTPRPLSLVRMLGRTEGGRLAGKRVCRAKMCRARRRVWGTPTPCSSYTHALVPYRNQLRTRYPSSFVRGDLRGFLGPRYNSKLEGNEASSSRRYITRNAQGLLAEKSDT